jgi:hypothetical protein
MEPRCADRGSERWVHFVPEERDQTFSRKVIPPATPPREVELLRVEKEHKENGLGEWKSLDRVDELAYIPPDPVFHARGVCVCRRARLGSGRLGLRFRRNWWSDWKKPSGSCARIRRRSSSRRWKNTSTGTGLRKSKRNHRNDRERDGRCQRKRGLWSAIGVGGAGPSTKSKGHRDPRREDAPLLRPLRGTLGYKRRREA